MYIVLMKNLIHIGKTYNERVWKRLLFPWFVTCFNSNDIVTFNNMKRCHLNGGVSDRFICFQNIQLTDFVEFVERRRKIVLCKSLFFFFLLIIFIMINFLWPRFTGLNKFTWTFVFVFSFWKTFTPILYFSIRCNFTLRFILFWLCTTLFSHSFISLSENYKWRCKRLN